MEFETDTGFPKGGPSVLFKNARQFECLVDWNPYKNITISEYSNVRFTANIFSPALRSMQ